MRGVRFAIGALMCAAVPVPAGACMGFADLDLRDVRYADVVVVGQITNYKVVSDRGPPTGSIDDYARFDVRVRDVLKGNAAPVLTVTWDNSTFAEQETLEPGEYLVALRTPESHTIPPLRGPSATILPRPEPSLPTLLQAPCSSAFIFKSGSKEAAAVRRIVSRGVKQGSR